MAYRSSFAWSALFCVVFVLGCSRDEPSSASVAKTSTPAVESHDAHEASGDAHAEHEASAVAPVLEPGKLWPTDEPLRLAMERIRIAVDRAASAQEGKRFTSTEAQALSAAVEENIAYMIANCKLEPKPDAALHVLIGRMSAAIAAIKNDPVADAGLAQIRAVLHDYQSTFDHPGWPRGA